MPAGMDTSVVTARAAVDVAHTEVTARASRIAGIAGPDMDAGPDILVGAGVGGAGVAPVGSVFLLPSRSSPVSASALSNRRKCARHRARHSRLPGATLLRKCVNPRSANRADAVARSASAALRAVLAAVDSGIVAISRTGVPAALRLTILDRMDVPATALTVATATPATATPATVPTVAATASTGDTGRASPTMEAGEADGVDNSTHEAEVNKS
jgi:hypothetical protein